MDGYHPNAFLAKKLLTEGLLEEDDIKDKPKESAVTKHKAKEKEKEKAKEKSNEPKETSVEKTDEINDMDIPSAPKKRLSNTSDESDTQVIIKKEEEKQVDKRKSNDIGESKIYLDSGANSIVQNQLTNFTCLKKVLSFSKCPQSKRIAPILCILA